MTIPEISAEPDGMKVGDKIANGDGIDATITSIEEGQWFWAYDQTDGTKSRLNINMRQYLDPMNPRAWKNEQGQIVFGYAPPPNIEPVVGNQIRCLLHKDNPIREHLNTIGLRGRYCSKEGYLATDFDLARHMQKSHGGENRIIMDNKASVERATDREAAAKATDAQMQTAKAMTAITERLVNDNSREQPEGDNGSADSGDGAARRGPGRPKQS